MALSMVDWHSRAMRSIPSSPRPERTVRCVFTMLKHLLRRDNRVNALRTRYTHQPTSAPPRISMNSSLDQALAALDGIVLGKPRQLRMALACLLARGHLLIEDIPGVGK